jgi:hypothetical protein
MTKKMIYMKPLGLGCSMLHTLRFSFVVLRIFCIQICDSSNFRSEDWHCIFKNNTTFFFLNLPILGVR